MSQRKFMNKAGSKNIFLFLLSIFFQITSNAAITSVQINGLVQQTDNKIVASASASVSGVNQIMVMRYNTDGSLDSTFGDNNTGLATVQIGDLSVATAVGIQSNDNIIATGYTLVGGVPEFVSVAYTPSGILDTAYGTSGITTQLIGDGAAAYGMAIQSDDSIIQVGVAVMSGVPQFGLLRLTSGGVADSSFGTGGVMTTAIGDFSSAQSVVIQPSNNKIIVAGWAFVSGVQEFALVRYNTDGTLDTSFGTSGIVTTIIGSTASISSVALDSSENIIVGGVSDNTFTVARYDSTGTLDTSFGTGGIVTTALGSNDKVVAVLVQSNDKIVAVGNTDSNIAIVRYNTDGTLDTSFGTGGIVISALQDVMQANAGLLQSDEKILAGGLINANSLIIRYNTNGTYDLNWGLQGIVSIPGGSYKILETLIYDHKTQGTNGGTFTSGAWRTRDLNVIIAASSNESLLNNQIILQPGIYAVKGSAIAYGVDSHQVRLRDITDSVTIAYGSSAVSDSTNPSATASMLETKVFVSKPTVFEIQHQCQTTKATDGFGLAANFGTEIYTTVKIIQES